MKTRYNVFVYENNVQKLTLKYRDSLLLYQVCPNNILNVKSKTAKKCVFN